MIVLRFCIFIIFQLFILSSLKSQGTSIINNKATGVYISKKNIAYSPYFYKILANFVVAKDTLDLADEELKLGLSIKLGEFLIPLLKYSFNSDSVYFVNKYPVLARTFIKNYQNQALTSYDFVRFLPYKTDYIIIIDNLKLENDIERSVMSYSNHIFTAKRPIIKAEAKLLLLNLKEKKIINSVLVNYNSKEPKISEGPLKFYKPFDNKGQEIFFDIFNLGLLWLLTTNN